MSTFKYIKCTYAHVFRVEGEADACYEADRFTLPDGREIRFDGFNIYIDGERVKKKYRGSFLYSDCLEKPLVKMLYMYPVKGIIIPEEKFAFFYVAWSFGPMTVVMSEGDTYLGIDAVVTLTRAAKQLKLPTVYIIQFLIDVEKEYFGRNSFEKYIKGVL